MLRTAGVAERQFAQGLTGAFAHQPGRGDETLHRPVVALKHLQTRMQAGQGCFARQAIELAFMGVDPAHEPVARVVRQGFLIVVVVAVQRQFIASGDPGIEHSAKRRVGV